jgi:hypothetical protein
LAELLVDVGSTVDDGGADPGSVSKLTSFIVDLGDKFTGGSKDKGCGISFAGTRVTVRLTMVWR